MEIASAQAHQTLYYLNALQDQGYSPTEIELTAYANNPSLRTTSTGGTLAMNLSAAVSGIMTTFREIYGATTKESYPELFQRLGWASIDDDHRVAITALGRAVVGALNDEEAFDSALLVSRVIEPNDPFAYARIIGEIASAENVLVVDPYLEVEGLAHLLNLQNVTRVLTSDGTQPDQRRASAKLAMLKHVIGASSAPDFALRSLKPKELHDRYVIPATGSVLNLSTSLNSIGSRIGVAVWLPDVPSAAIRKANEGLWNKATVVEPIGRSLTLMEIEDTEATR